MWSPAGILKNHEVILHLDCGVGEGTGGWSLLILFDRMHTHSLSHSLMWALFNLKCGVYAFRILGYFSLLKHFLPLLPFSLCKASSVLSFKLIMFSKLAQNWLSCKAVGEAHGSGQMIAPSLRKFFLCSSCVCVASLQVVIIQASCDQLLFHSDVYKMQLQWVCLVSQIKMNFICMCLYCLSSGRLSLVWRSDPKKKQCGCVLLFSIA